MRCDAAHCECEPSVFEYVGGIAYKWCADCYEDGGDFDDLYTDGYTEDYRHISKGEYIVLTVMAA